MAAPVASAALKSRIRRPSLLSKLAHPEDLIQHFPHGAYIGWSGFTGVGYPKYFILLLSLFLDSVALLAWTSGRLAPS